MKSPTERDAGVRDSRDTVLVVDDHPENIRLLFETLKGAGFRTLAAVNGKRAVEQAALALPDLILMDVMMPEMDGFTACRKLREDESTRSIPVVFMTALNETVDKVRGFEAGGVDYLSKPLQHREVLARIHAHLGRHRLWREIDAYSRLLLNMGSAGSLAEAWEVLSSLVREHRELAGLAFWEVSPDTEELLLNCHSGFTDGGPSTWPHATGNYSRIPRSDLLFAEALRENRQGCLPNPRAWPGYPDWAAVQKIRAAVTTPVICRDQIYGVLFAAYHAPDRPDLTEQRRWQHILAGSLGNVIFQTRAAAEIQELSEQLRRENRGLRAEISLKEPREDLIGESPAFRQVLAQLDLVAPTDTAVLILGESGTGKELLAQRLHQRSPRADGPLIRVNCAAIPAELFESEFFGHVKGAFTGAVQDRIGRFELADGGTLFLDEVGEIPLQLQGKLLRVLQEGTFERVGEEKTRKTGVRIAAATNRNLAEAVAQGRFREDLYYRLSIFPLTLPPLRDRKTDIPALARRFAERSARKRGLSLPGLPDSAFAPLLRYDWPGNVRELENEIERNMILSKGAPLRFDTPESSRPGGGGTPPESARILKEEEWRKLQHGNILRALKSSRWRVDGPGGAAEKLGLRPTTLRSRMKSMNIVRPG